MNLNTVGAVLQQIGQASDVMASGRNLISETKKFQVEPITIVESSLVHDTEIMPEVMQTLQSQFTGFWLQAWDVVSNVESATVLANLDRINPQRDPDYMAFIGRMHDRYVARESLYFTRESYEFGLPMNNSHQVTSPGVENNKGQDVTSAPANLAVGKMVTVCSTTGTGREAVRREHRVAIRLIPIEVNQETLMNMSVDTSEARSLMSRVSQWWGNDISTADLVFGLDLIRERKRQLLKDKSGIYEEVRKRQLNHKRAGLLTGQASKAELSNLVVISKEFADSLIVKHGLDVTDSRDRSKIMQNMQAMILTVVDRMNLRVQFYFIDYAKGASMGINDIRIANRKSNGPDLMDLLSSFKEGKVGGY